MDYYLMNLQIHFEKIAGSFVNPLRTSRCEEQLRFAPAVEVIHAIHPAETALVTAIEGFDIPLVERRCRLFQRLIGVFQWNPVLL